MANVVIVVKSFKTSICFKTAVSALKTQYAAAHCIEEQRADQKNCASQYLGLLPVITETLSSERMNGIILSVLTLAAKCTSEIYYGNTYIFYPITLASLPSSLMRLRLTMISCFISRQSQRSLGTNQQFRINSVAQLFIYIFPSVSSEATIHLSTRVS